MYYYMQEKYAQLHFILGPQPHEKILAALGLHLDCNLSVFLPTMAARKICHCLSAAILPSNLYPHWHRLELKEVGTQGRQQSQGIVEGHISISFYIVLDHGSGRGLSAPGEFCQVLILEANLVSDIQPHHGEVEA